MGAASEGPGGMHTVMNFILNRAQNDPSKFVPTVLKGKPFSSFNKVIQGKQSLDKLVKMAKGDYMWEIAIVITKEAYKKRLRDITFGTDHYASYQRLPLLPLGARAWSLPSASARLHLLQLS